MLGICRRRLIDGRGRPPLEPAAVLVDGERIAAVGRAPYIEISVGIDVIDRGDETLRPGLIDAHGHLVLTPDDPRTTLEPLSCITIAYLPGRCV